MNSAGEETQAPWASRGLAIPYIGMLFGEGKGGVEMRQLDLDTCTRTAQVTGVPEPHTKPWLGGLEGKQPGKDCSCRVAGDMGKRDTNGQGW